MATEVEIPAVDDEINPSTQIINELNDDETVIAGPTSQVAPDTEVEDVADTEVGDAATSGDWVTDEVESLGLAYGLSREDITGLGSAENFDRVTRIWDKQLRSHLQPAQPFPQQYQPQQYAPQQWQQPASAPPAPQAAPSLTPLDITKYNSYDDDVKAVVAKYNEMVEHANQRAQQYDQQLNQLQQAVQFVAQNYTDFNSSLAQQTAYRDLEIFHDLADNLDESRFGRSLDEHGRVLSLSAAHDANRRQLFEARRALQQMYRDSGQATPDDRSLLRRAERMAFGDEMIASQQAQHADKLRAQSARRRPVAGSRVAPAPTEHSDDPKTEARRIANLPEMKRLFANMES